MSRIDPVLRVQGLCKRHGEVDVLRGVDLQLPAAAVLGLVGLNGSGKTTTIECLLGLQGFHAGDVSVLGRRPRDLYRLQGEVVAIFDTPSVAPHLTVRQCLEHARLLCPRPVRGCAEVEGLLGLEGYSRHRIRQLSLGNRRRVSIAQALLGEPKLIVLDEPFNGLDAGGVDQVLELIAELNRQSGTAFLLSSHQLPYLERVCSHFAILHDGGIAASGELPELLADSAARVVLHSSEPQLALEALAGDKRVAVCGGSADEGASESIELRLLDNWRSDELVALLVERGVPVCELIRQRASLEQLFRELTAGEPQ